MMEKQTETNQSSFAMAVEEGVEEDVCAVIPPETLRLYIVAIAGNSIATCSLLFNAFLFAVLVKKEQNRRNLLYLILMALIDVFLSASYILLFPVNLMMDYYESELLAAIWWNCLRPTLALCHVAISTSALLLTAATFERFLTITRIGGNFTSSQRLLLSSIALGAALVAKGPMFFELNIMPNDNCTGVTAYVPHIHAWTFDEPYRTAYKFCFRSIVSTFLPFFLSFYFNVRIVMRLRHQQAAARLFRFATSEHRKNIRSATTMLVLVAFCYLGCNLLNVVVTAWEFVDIESLHREGMRDLYTYSSDMVSLLTVLACAVRYSPIECLLFLHNPEPELGGFRLPIYYACNAKIRNEVNCQLKALFRCSANHKQHLMRNNNPSCKTMRYLNTANGLIIYASSDENSVQRIGKNADGEGERLMVGTHFDKITLQLAIRGLRKKERQRSSSEIIMRILLSFHHTCRKIIKSVREGFAFIFPGMRISCQPRKLGYQDIMHTMCQETHCGIVLPKLRKCVDLQKANKKLFAVCGMMLGRRSV